MEPASALRLLLCVAAAVTAAAASEARWSGSQATMEFKACGTAAAAAQDEDDIFFHGTAFMKYEPRAICALEMLRALGVFEPCRAPGAKLCAVVDLGAGHMSALHVLQTTMKMSRRVVQYVPVDYFKRHAQTVVCDLNALEFPQLDEYDVGEG